MKTSVFKILYFFSLLCVIFGKFIFDRKSYRVTFETTRTS